MNKIEAYALHAHVRPGSDDETPLDYSAFCRWIARESSRLETVKFGRRVVAFSSVEESGNILTAELLVGEEGDEMIILDLLSGEIEEHDLDDHQIPVRAVMIAIDPESRTVAIEKRRPGITVREVERVFEILGSRANDERRLAFTLAPVPTSSFADAIATLDRITSASIRVARPNFSWTKSAESLLEAQGQESNAGKITLEATASPRSSLSRDSGIVHEIEGLAERRNPSVEDASVSGKEAQSGASKVVRLKRHVVHRFRSIRELGLGERHATMRSATLHMADERASTENPGAPE